MMEPASFLILFLAVLVLSVIFTWTVLGLLKHFGVFDVPTARSSHSSPTPKGGGLAVLGVCILSILTLGFFGKISLSLSVNLSFISN